MVKTFCENEGLKTVEKHLMDVITSTDEWINRCPQRKNSGTNLCLVRVVSIRAKAGGIRERERRGRQRGTCRIIHE